MIPKIKYISDLHLDGRGPFRAEHPEYSCLAEWHKDFVQTWNSNVVASDYIWIVGDVCLTMTEAVKDVLSQLRGHLLLVRGNHDKVAKTPEYSIFFEQIHDIVEVADSGKAVVLCHYPLESWNRKIYGSVHIHGHIHGNIWDAPSALPNRYNVWSTALGGIPRTLDWLMERDGYQADYYQKLYVGYTADKYKIG